MSFKLFIYYCALCGGWAAFLAFLFVQAAGIRALYDSNKDVLASTLIAGILGMLLAGAVGLVDALLNAGAAGQRVGRVGVCVAVGLVGGLLSGCIGEIVHQLVLRVAGVDSRVPGWVLVGVVIGASVAVFDIVQAAVAGQAPATAVRKLINGALGGLVGGCVGGLLFELLRGALPLPLSRLAIGFVVLGGCIGLLIGLAQVILKEAWVRREKGFRAGREMMLSKPAITIGRSEASDIGIFGDNAVEKLHARILLQGDRYLVADAGTVAGTFVNDERIMQPRPLRSGDAIRIGNNVLRFGERQKRAR